MHAGCNHNIEKSREMCIRKVPIFHDLTDEEMLEVLKRSKQMLFKKGDTLYRAGDPIEYLYIVHTGRVKVYQLFETGKEQLLRILETGAFMGELAFFAEKQLERYAEALEDTEICAIHRNDMHALMRSHPAISLKILKEFSIRLEAVEDLFGQLSYQDVETRIASYLVRLVKTMNDTSVVLPMSKRDLASHLGTTQETISRRLAHIQMNGWIEQEGQRNIKVLNLAALEAIAKE